MSSPAGVQLRGCRSCGAVLHPADGHERCFLCLSWLHAAEEATCPHCLALPREERERRRGFMDPPPPRPDPETVAAESGSESCSSASSSSRSRSPPPSAQPTRLESSPLPKRPKGANRFDKAWDDYDAMDDQRVYEEDVGTILGEKSPDRYPLDQLPGLFRAAADRLEIDFPPQPGSPVDPLSGLAGPSRARRRLGVVSPRIQTVLDYAQREWSNPMAAKNPALAYGPYATVQGWEVATGLPPIEDGVRMSLLPSSSPWARGSAAHPSERDRVTVSMLNRCYANATQVVALASNMALLAASLDRMVRKRDQLTAEELTEVETSAATFCRMAQALAVDGGRSMCATQVAARHLWLELSSLKETDRRELLNLPLSRDSLFGPDMQTLVERMESAAKASAQLAPHLRPQSRQRPKRRRSRSSPRRRAEAPPRRPVQRSRDSDHRRGADSSRDQRRDSRPNSGPRGGRRGGREFSNKGLAQARYRHKRALSSPVANSVPGASVEATAAKSNAVRRTSVVSPTASSCQMALLSVTRQTSHGAEFPSVSVYPQHNAATFRKPRDGTGVRADSLYRLPVYTRRRQSSSSELRQRQSGSGAYVHTSSRQVTDTGFESGRTKSSRTALSLPRQGEKQRERWRGAGPRLTLAAANSQRGRDLHDFHISPSRSSPKRKLDVTSSLPCKRLRSHNDRPRQRRLHCRRNAPSVRADSANTADTEPNIGAGVPPGRTTCDSVHSTALAGGPFVLSTHSRPFPGGPLTDTWFSGSTNRERARSSAPHRFSGAPTNGVLPGVEGERPPSDTVVKQNVEEGLCATVHAQTSSLHRDSLDAFAKSRRDRSAHGGNNFPAPPRCGDALRTGEDGRRLVLPVLPGSQENWRFSSYFGPADSKWLCSQEKFPHADSQTPLTVCPSGGLDDFGGPHGCILPCPRCTEAQKVPALCNPGPVLRILPPAFRLLPGSTDIYEMRGGSPRPASSSGSSHSDVHRRLANSRLLPTGGERAHLNCTPPHCHSRVRGQSGEECTAAHTTADLLGSAFGLRGLQGLPVGGAAGGNPQPRKPYVERLPRIPTAGALPPGNDGGGASRGEIGAPAHESPSALVSQASEEGRAVEAGSALPRRTSGSQILDVPGSSPEGRYPGMSVSLHRSVHGRLPDGVGRRAGAPGCGGALVTPTETHKSPGNGGGPEDPPLLCQGDSRSPRHDPVGQRDGGGLPEQTGRDTLPSPSYVDSGDPLLGGIPSRLPTCSPHSWGEERGRGQNVQRRRSGGGMGPQSRGGQGRVASVRCPSGRPFRQCRKRTVPTLVLAQVNRRATARGRRSGSRGVASGPSLRLPAGPSHVSPTPESTGGDSPHPGGSAGSSEGQMVSRSGPDGSVRSLAPSGQAGCLAPGRRLPPLASDIGTAATGLGAERGKLLGLGLPSRVVATIQGARAPSTSKAYEIRWRVFQGWCAERDLDPSVCTISSVLEFLQDLLDKGRAAATLGVFAAAIATGHVGFHDFSARNHPLVKRFLRGARRINPPSRRVTPAWELQVVLDGLSSPPFEPFDRADISHVSYKTAILLALASAKRSGDLCALSIHPSCMSFTSGDGLMELWPNPAFQPKVITSSFRSRAIRVRPFYPPPHGSPEEERLHCLCPIRAVRGYLARTAGFRRSDQLFVHFGARSRGDALSTQRLAHWVCQAIRVAYEVQGRPVPSGVRAHSTRGVAASTALFHGTSIEEVCMAASWSSSSTFVRSYLLDVTPGSVTHAVLGGRRV